MPVKNIVPGQKISADKLERAKQLRREMTSAEAVLWRELQGNKLGAHFRRQQIIAGYIVDFYCHAAALVIELDGGIHQGGQQAQADAQRDAILRELGLRVVRIRNEAVTTSLPEVLQQIRTMIRV